MLLQQSKEENLLKQPNQEPAQIHPTAQSSDQCQLFHLGEYNVNNTNANGINGSNTLK